MTDFTPEVLFKDNPPDWDLLLVASDFYEESGDLLTAKALRWLTTYKPRLAFCNNDDFKPLLAFCNNDDSNVPYHDHSPSSYWYWAEHSFAGRETKKILLGPYLTGFSSPTGGFTFLLNRLITFNKLLEVHL